MRTDTDFLELLDGVRHQAFAACLVDRPGAAFHDDDVQTGLRGMGGCRQSARSPACNQQVDHANLASALFSVVMRVVSSAALSTVKTSAVIQAVWTRGNATPSAITAT